VEVLQGENEQSFGTEGFRLVDNINTPTTSITIGDTKKPNLYLGFVKTSFDVGNLSFLTDFPLQQGIAELTTLKETIPTPLQERTKLYGFDLTAKYMIDSYRYISLQGEYLYRDQKGTKYEYNDNTGDLETAELKKKQGGFYTQLVFKFDKKVEGRHSIQPH